MTPVATRMTTVTAVADRNRRSASELACIGRRRQQITEAAHGLDDLDAELLANAADEHLDGVGIAVEILIVEMLDQFGARYHAARMVHQVRQQPVLMRGELDRRATHRNPPGTAVEPHWPAQKLALGVADRTAQQRPNARQHLFKMERLWHIVVGARIETLHLVAPAVARGEQQERHDASGAAP